jgi:hypothetical protein
MPDADSVGILLVFFDNVIPETSIHQGLFRLRGRCAALTQSRTLFTASGSLGSLKPTNRITGLFPYYFLQLLINWYRAITLPEFSNEISQKFLDGILGTDNSLQNIKKLKGPLMFSLPLTKKTQETLSKSKSSLSASFFTQKNQQSRT